MIERRRVEDYTSEDWMDAADTCQLGGVRYQVRLQAIDVEQQTATVLIRAVHGEDCDDERGEEESVELGGWGWSPAGEVLELQGACYPWYDWFADVVPCLGCQRLVVGVPFLLFGSKGILAFCPECFNARQLGHLLQLGTGPREGDDD